MNLVEHVYQKAEGCCGDAAWRQHLCSYHEGFLDGMDEYETLQVSKSVSLEVTDSGNHSD